MARNCQPERSASPVRTRAEGTFPVGLAAFRRVNLERCEASAHRIEALKSPADQLEQSVRILDDRSDVLRRCAGRLRLPRTEPAGCRILEAVEAIRCSGPDYALMVDHQAEYDIVAQAAGVGGSCRKIANLPVSLIVPVQAAICAEPQVSRAILDDRDHVA